MHVAVNHATSVSAGSNPARRTSEKIRAFARVFRFMTRREMVRMFIIFFIVFIAVPSAVLAQQNILPGQIVPATCNEPGGCKSICDIATVAQNILNTGIYIAVFLSAVLFAWAGWLYLTSVGNS